MVRIMHTGDWHLGSMFLSADETSAMIRRGEHEKVCADLLEKAKEYDVVLLSGDVFDAVNVSEKVADLLLTGISDAPDTRFFWSCGNHDPYYSHIVDYCIENAPGNLHVFSPHSVECVELTDLKMRIYGRSFPERNVKESYLSEFKNKFPGPDGNYVNILCMHAELTESSCGTYNPLRSGDIKSSGFDYIALGHVHSYSGMHRLGNSLYAYCGCPSGRGFDECGDKGYISLEICDSAIKGKFVSGFCRKYIDEKIDISDIKDYSEIISLINDIAGNGNICRIELIGENHIGPFLNIDYIKKSADVHSLICTDNTRQIVDPRDFCDCVSFVGRCGAAAVEMIENAKNDREKEIIRKAFALINAELDKRR